MLASPRSTDNHHDASFPVSVCEGAAPPGNIVHEASRLAVLKRYAVLDSGSEPAFDRVADLARVLFGTPTALVSFVDETRAWFKAHAGMASSEAPRASAFCSHAILSAEPLVIADASLDPRFADNPLVTGGPRIRFYAGAPITSPDGFRLGTVCVTSTEPRPEGMSADDRTRLSALAAAVTEALELRLRGRMLAEAVAERSAALAAAEALAAERDLLAREADHRIKNELQRLHGVLLLQVGTMHETAPRAALEAAARRVLAMAAAHRHLHDCSTVGQGDAGAYLAALVAELSQPAGVEDCRTITFAGQLGPLLPAPLLSRLGLITAELVSNALKHGAGHVRVDLRSGQRQGELLLGVSDEGPGFPPGFEPGGERASLGLRLVTALSGRGNVRIDDNDRRRVLVRIAINAGPASPGGRKAR